MCEMNWRTLTEFHTEFHTWHTWVILSKIYKRFLNVFVISLKFNALETISTASVSIIQRTLHYYDWILMDDSVTFVEVPNN